MLVQARTAAQVIACLPLDHKILQQMMLLLLQIHLSCPTGCKKLSQLRHDDSCLSARSHSSGLVLNAMHFDQGYLEGRTIFRILSQCSRPHSCHTIFFVFALDKTTGGKVVAKISHKLKEKMSRLEMIKSPGTSVGSPDPRFGDLSFSPHVPSQFLYFFPPMSRRLRF